MSCCVGCAHSRDCLLDKTSNSLIVVRSLSVAVSIVSLSVLVGLLTTCPGCG